MSIVTRTNPSHGSIAITDGIRIGVKPFYLPEHSNVEENRHVFAYHVNIVNEGDERVQVISRHWTIIDGNGGREEVRGPGVVGEQPVLEPGAEFKYTSYCPLRTEWGTMEGEFQVQRSDGSTFDARIDRFILARPEATP